MIAILKYNLNDELDMEKYLDTIKASNMKSILIDIRHHLRSKIKHQEMSEETLKHLEETYDYLHECLNDYDITLP